jgi:hypothetical protein
MGLDWERRGDTLRHAGTPIGISLVVCVAIVDSEGGCGTGLNDDPSRWHLGKDLSPSVVSDTDRLSFVGRAVKLKFGVALEAASGVTDIYYGESDSVVARGGISTRIRFHRHRDLFSGARGYRSR